MPPARVGCSARPTDPSVSRKAAAAADVVILDLEDGVAESDKPAARQALQDNPLDPERTVVRINAAGTDEHARDLDALNGTAYTTVMLAKTESAAQVTALAPRAVIALVETPRAAVFATEIAAAAGTVGVMWGAEDLVAALGGSSSRRADGTYRDFARHVRSTVLLAASAFDRIALDAVHLNIRDIEGLQAEADDAVAVGFDATVCIHPTQIDDRARRPTAPATRNWIGRDGFWLRPRPSAGSSPSKARWSIPRCSNTRRRCWHERENLSPADRCRAPSFPHSDLSWLGPTATHDALQRAAE